MKPKFIDYYMNIAQLTAQLSYAKKLQVGAVIVKGNQILSSGYNGMPSGWENVCEVNVPEQIDPDTRTITPEHVKSKPEVMHAEMNALMRLAASTESSHGATLFITHNPCLDCAKAIYQAGIDVVYYKYDYRSNAGIEFLQKTGINIIKISD